MSKQDLVHRHSQPSSAVIGQGSAGDASPGSETIFPVISHLTKQEQRIFNLEASLHEMISVYWGEGDGHEPPPACIQRAKAALWSRS